MRERREALGLSQRELGELCDCTGVAVLYWEQLRAHPHRRYRTILERELGLPLDALLRPINEESDDEGTSLAAASDRVPVGAR
jgi:transcriptional regulator with XRE-family HTH domain